jgi:hypothetical protein
MPQHKTIGVVRPSRCYGIVEWSVALNQLVACKDVPGGAERLTSTKCSAGRF